MSVKPPLAFLNYALTDPREIEKVRAIAEGFGRTMRFLWGEDFPILDQNDWRWHRQWIDRVEKSLDATAFLLPIITPEYLRSRSCRSKFDRFLRREQDLKRSGLILPLYYVNCPVINDPYKRASVSFARILGERHYQDWRDLREQPNNTLEAARRFERMAERIMRFLERGGSQQPARPMTLSRAGTAKSQSAETQTVSPVHPPALVVDEMGGGDYKSIAAAIEVAEHGTQILIRPGMYSESLSIKKPLDIIGDGSREDIVIEAMWGSCVKFSALTGRIANLTLRQSGKGFAIDIVAGRLMLKHCDMRSQGLSCVAIHGGAKPEIRRNRIYVGGQNGIYVFEQGAGLIEENQIVASAFSGIEIRDKGNPIIRRNLIHAGETSGILVQRNGAALIEENEIVNNAASGMAVRWGGKAIARRNHIVGNRGGIRVYAGGCGIFENNILRGNANNACIVAPGSDPNVKLLGNIES